MHYPLILAFKFKDYKGGENPLLVYIFIICVVLGLGATLWVYIKRWSLKRLFYSTCKQRKLSDKQMSVFTHYMSMQKLPLDPQILKNRIRFDKFINKVGYHLVATHESYHLADKELKTLIDLRKILFPTQNSKDISSSRSMDQGMKVEVSFFDEKKSRYVSFQSKILENTDCGLRVSVEEIPGIGQVNINSPVSIQFLDPFKKHNKIFESYVMFQEVEGDNNIWLVQHSYFIQDEVSKELHLDAKVYVSKGEEVNEYPVTITYLCMNGCDVKEEGLPDESALLQVVLLDKECNIAVQMNQREGGGSVLTFTSLDDEIRSQIRKSMR